jgi:hypothetical protein
MLKAGLPGRRRMLVAIALAVVAAHGCLLGGMVGLASPRPQEAVAAAVQLRAIDVPPPPPAALPAPVPAAAVAPVVARQRPAAVAPGAVVVPAPSAEPVATEPAAAEAVVAQAPGASAPEPVEAPMPVEAPTLVATAGPAVPPAAVSRTPSADAPPPVYATRLPPSATLRYDLQRGSIGGTGELRWQRDGDRYELRLQGTVVGIPVLLQVSQGAVDAAGIAPVRFTDQRVRRSPLAANFQREAHKVTFSGTSAEVPLGEGAQDRLSWMVQLAGIVAADPGRGEPGARTALQVVGARGDSSIWVFRCVGLEPMHTRAGTVPTLHLVRESRGPYDTAVAIWLDPARHHLPLRATWRNGDDGEVLELKLKDLSIGG